MGIAKALAAKNGYELDSNQEVRIETFSQVVFFALSVSMLILAKIKFEAFIYIFSVSGNMRL